MALTFDGTSFLGTHGLVITTPSHLQTSRQKFWGVEGESEIVGGRGGRNISAEVWIHHSSYTTPEQVFNEMRAMDAAIGRNGDLLEIGTITRVWSECTFLGFEQQSDILPIVGGQLTGSYFVHGVIHFYSKLPPFA